MFIHLDGIDGGGKSTQISLLQERLLSETGRQVTCVRDPGSTVAGEAIRKLLLDSDLEMHRRCEALLYMAARSQLVEERIRPALNEGGIVISDRFLLANVVYQSVGGGEDPEVLWELGEIATGGLRPDLTLLLDLPVEVSMERIQRPVDRMESRGEEYMRRVREGFLAHLSRSGGRSVVIDATETPEDVAAAIWAATSALL